MSEEQDQMDDWQRSQHVEMQRRHLGSISSSMGGDSRAGDIAADKRMNLLHAQGEPQLGRRTNDPEPEAPWYKRKEFFVGILSGLLVIVGVVVVLMVGAGFVN